MEDDFDSVASAKGAPGDPGAAQLAMNAGASEEARDYLRRQSRLADLQIENLAKLDAFETSHLRWRRFNDQMKGALQIMLVALGLCVVAGIIWAVWSASQADGLVVDSFSVPPAYAQSGIGGDVVADDMTAKIATIRDFANANSLAGSNAVREDRQQDVKVEIPDTGISLAEAWRYLKLWFGHERHLSGNLRALKDGRAALTLTLGGADSFIVVGNAGDLNALEQTAAERIFAAVDPINIVLYLSAKGRRADALEAARRNIMLSTGNPDLAEAYALYALQVRVVTGNVRRSAVLARYAIALDAKGAPQHMEMLNSSRALGHDQDVLAQAWAITLLKRGDNVGSWRAAGSTGFDFVQQLGAEWRDRETGDFTNLSSLPCIYDCSPGDAPVIHAEALARLHDPAAALAAIAQQRSIDVSQTDPFDPSDLARVRTFIDIARGDWRAAAADARAYIGTPKADTGIGPGYGALLAHTRAEPLLAQALAATGDFAGAHKAADDGPLDCYACLLAHAAVDGRERNWNGAVYWFARAVKQAPSIPFAYSDWGAMLLAKGDAQGAIAKFESAHAKSPHFADPLEMWGEALIAKNRSDLALAKFAEANKYAPNWGRLHLKWGEALLWSGDHDGARKQFTIAAALDLSLSEKSERARMGALHG
ncbi:MAG TPA: hypothetical protein VID67_15860 [Rhizomicrobium sp.]|jgi:tetratricopeptide (TPR) repeat protein